MSKMVPVSGLEPEEKQGLSLSRLPFRQTGIIEDLKYIRLQLTIKIMGLFLSKTNNS